MRTAAAAVACIAGICGSVSAAQQSVELAGDDHTGYFATTCVKNWGSEAFALQGLPGYPYFEKPEAFGGQGVWTSLVAEPISPDSDYSVYAGRTVLNTGGPDDGDTDFATRSSGRVLYDDSVISGVGMETIPPGSLTIEIDGASFSPLNSSRNAGSGLGNAGWDYVVEATPLSGGGLTLVDGAPVSFDLVADVSLTIRFGGFDTAAFPSTYDGSLTLSGNTFAFDIDVTQDNASPLGALTDTRVVVNRAGTIESLAAGGGCSPADLTTTGATLAGQLGFGEADGIVDLDDLGYFLGFWLGGDLIADFTSTGATLPGQIGFGEADGVVDLDDLGFFLGLWLAGCP
ncbi:MAG: GC-type dockerin domain-anchored protein [Planctomycetota bacterium]